MSAFSLASSRRGASVLAAMVFIALVGLVAGGLQAIAPEAPGQSQLGAGAATTPAAATKPVPTPPEREKVPFEGCKDVTMPSGDVQQQCSCNQKETRAAEQIIEACMPGCTYKVTNTAGKDAAPKFEVVPVDASAVSKPFAKNINDREKLATAQKGEATDQCAMRVCDASGKNCKDVKGVSGAPLKDALLPVTKENLSKAESDLEAAKKAREESEKKVREAQEKMDAFQNVENACSNNSGFVTGSALYGGSDKCAISAKDAASLQKEYGITCSSYSDTQSTCKKSDIDSIGEYLQGDVKAQQQKVAENAALQARLEQQVQTLQGQVAGFEVGGGGATPCAGTNCPPGGPPPGAPPGGSPDYSPRSGGNPDNNTFGPGGLGSGMSGGMGGLGGIGSMLGRMFGGGQQQNPYGQNPYGQNPYGQQMCQTQYVCQGNTLVYRTPQCLQQPMQQCQYGCDQTGTMCAQQPSPYGRGTDGQPCPQPPAKPDAAQCSAGVWQSLSATNNGCTTGWKCSTTDNPSAKTPTATLSCTPQVADIGATVSIQYSCSAGTITATGFTITSSALAGTASVTVAASSGNLATYGITCADSGLTAGAQCNVQVARPSIVLVANPKKVKAGETSSIGWVTSGMKACTVSSPDLAAFTEANKNNQSVNGVATTPAINTSVTINLSCETLGGSTRTAETRIEVE